MYLGKQIFQREPRVSCFSHNINIPTRLPPLGLVWDIFTVQTFGHFAYWKESGFLMCTSIVETKEEFQELTEV